MTSYDSMTSTLPPAASIFVFAASLMAFTLTVRAFSIVPLARILIPSPVFRITPAGQQGRCVHQDVTGEAVELIQVDDDNLLAEDILKALLGKPARKRHLASLVARPGVMS